LKKIYFKLYLGILGEEDSGKEIFLTFLDKNKINSIDSKDNEYILVYHDVPLKLKLYLAENFKLLREHKEDIKRLDILIITLNQNNLKSFNKLNFDIYNEFCESFDFKGVSILAIIDAHLTKFYDRSNIIRIDKKDVIKKSQEYNIVYCFEIQNDTTDIMELFQKVFDEFVFKFQLSNPDLFERVKNYGKTLINQNQD
jgi:hypothetical protein